jgi:hypothetical protein
VGRASAKMRQWAQKRVLQVRARQLHTHVESWRGVECWSFHWRYGRLERFIENVNKFQRKKNRFWINRRSFSLRERKVQGPTCNDPAKSG